MNNIEKHKMLDAALVIAVEEHSGQVDKAGAAYIHHVLRVMTKSGKHKDIEIMCIATLHDVVEDSYLSIDYLEGLGFSERIIAGVDCITRRPGESHKDYYTRVKSNRDSLLVKLEDLEDNCDLTRIGDYTNEDALRTKKYEKSIKELQAHFMEHYNQLKIEERYND